MSDPGDLIFSLWLPGQMPSGKNDTEVDYKQGRVRPKRRKDGSESPFTRWFKSLQVFTRPPPRHPYDAPLDIDVDYWWGDLHNRDEDGRSSALGSFLEGTKYIADDKHVRWHWRPRGLDRANPGVLVNAFAAPEIDESPLPSVGVGRGGTFPGVLKWRGPAITGRRS